jgi:hypothetical protein
MFLDNAKPDENAISEMHRDNRSTGLLSNRRTRADQTWNSDAEGVRESHAAVTSLFNYNAPISLCDRIMSRSFGQPEVGQ